MSNGRQRKARRASLADRRNASQNPKPLKVRKSPKWHLKTGANMVAGANNPWSQLRIMR